MINVYCCGGAGSNIGKAINGTDSKVCYVDTSISNLKGVDVDDIYLVEDRDGAGQLRSNTYAWFRGLEEEVLIRFKPSDTLNVIVHSLGGGSGSVIGPMLAREMINRGHRVIVIAIESRDSTKRIQNTLATLQTYQGVVNSLKSSVSLMYVENDRRKQADEEILTFIELMSVITNKEHVDEFDTEDINNFINFDNVTDYDPGVGIISLIKSKGGESVRGTATVSTIYITTDKDSSIEDNIPDYLTTCYLVSDRYNLYKEVRINNTIGALALLVEDLNKDLEKLSDDRKINKIKTVEVEASDDGMVL